MSEMHTIDGARAVEFEWHAGELPALSRLDRLSLRIGLALILRAHRQAERQTRAEQARLSAGPREAVERTTFEHRAAAGTRW